MAIALLGWLGGIPFGFGLGALIMWFLGNEFHTTFDYLYPAWPLGVALLVTVMMSLAVLRLPLRRAIRMRPGTALRYQ
jgi:ABC-type antimicrobial peptide transport system permease subunit